MRTGRSVVALTFSGLGAAGVAVFVDFRPRFGVVPAVVIGGGDACCWTVAAAAVVRRLDLVTIGDCSVVKDVGLRRVLTVGTVCGVVGRLKPIEIQ